MAVVGKGGLNELTDVFHSCMIGSIVARGLVGSRRSSCRCKDVFLLAWSVGVGVGVVVAPIGMSISTSSTLVGVTVGATRAASSSSTTTTTSIRGVVVVALGPHCSLGDLGLQVQKTGLVILGNLPQYQGVQFKYSLPIKMKLYKSIGTYFRCIWKGSLSGIRLVLLIGAIGLIRELEFALLE